MKQAKAVWTVPCARSTWGSWLGPVTRCNPTTGWDLLEQYNKTRWRGRRAGVGVVRPEKPLRGPRCDRDDRRGLLVVTESGFILKGKNSSNKPRPVSRCWAAAARGLPCEQPRRAIGWILDPAFATLSSVLFPSRPGRLELPDGLISWDFRSRSIPTAAETFPKGAWCPALLSGRQWHLCLSKDCRIQPDFQPGAASSPSPCPEPCQGDKSLRSLLPWGSYIDPNRHGYPVPQAAATDPPASP
ncbi:transmembrane protein 131 [Platysternon megacephalum]|uniref:Transmembrane protein 131 n=1 Tax=Platysternon megacephalum TaxID=55544 RepID=A0A4D9EJR5_9SAUR|nr:transmembrane protein 131 [Platysternon megacephalum]